VSRFRRRRRSTGDEAEAADEEVARRGWLQRRLESRRERRVVAVSAGVMGVAMVGVLLFSAGSFWWTSQPSFCDRCHVMNKYVDSWAQSAHQDVNCEKCHLTPGLFGFLGGKIAGLQVVMNYIRGEYEDYSFSAAVSNASCLQCHRTILDENVHDAKAGVIVSHRNIVESGGKCVACHSTVAHGDAIPVGSATHPSMQTCLTCHNDETAPLRCSLCHVGREPPSATPPPSAPTQEPGG
jgi:nitrate/TMAO reductase-like tetraheme cytochrome c subunit